LNVLFAVVDYRICIIGYLITPTQTKPFGSHSGLSTDQTAN
jgi:hypothetical protein